ncbi:MAG: minichromosome maintenance protein MCM [Thaumarchaeota archaeon]|nr:minichromosome maintenance protein MCM [Nitrososphaerota archaeon]MCY3976413.1 minichromosome maintenance protein MCM [Nitrososphaerota archaeon]
MSITKTYTPSALSDLVKKFLAQFKDNNGSYKYVEQIDEMMAKHVQYAVIDYNDLVSNRDIEIKFEEQADKILDAFKRAIKEILQERFPQYAEKIQHEIRTRITNYPIQRSIRQINAELISKMASISGMVVRASEIKPLARELVYVCPDGHITNIILERGLKITPPPKCSHDKCKHRDLGIESESSKFIDFQIVRLQELPEDLPPGQLPHYIDVTVKQDLVDNARPGDRIILTGIVRIEQDPLPGAKTNSALYRLRIDGNNIEFLGGRGTQTSRSIEREEISLEEAKIIKSLSESPNIYHKLINSFAPHIHGHSLIKEAILLLIVGSTKKILADGTKIRGDINIFLVGDPGTAKSEMLKFCARVAPRGLYTSGRGSTAAGLTAAIVRDKIGIMMLEAGAVVLGDQGLVCIDEFDKMKPEDRSALHEVMEQQTVSIAKGGIVATLNARTSILAAANPMYGKYDPFKNITENVNLPIPLLTRFDLIFVVRDIPSREKDTQIAKHIINLHSLTKNEYDESIDVDILTKYLSHAKKSDPILTQDAEKRILKYYMKMRNVESEDMITVTPRQLEGLIRLSTARAKLLMKDRVDADDAENAIHLIQSMLENAGVDVNTGKVDLGVLQGKPRSEISKMQFFMDTLKALEGDNKKPVEEKLFVDELIKSNRFKEEEAKSYIRKMLYEASIYESKPGHYNRV